MYIIPRPNTAAVYLKGSFHFTSPVAVSFGSFAESCVSAFAARTSLEFHSGDVGAQLMLIRDESLAPEEYRLVIETDCVKITAATENGVILALTTVYESLNQQGCADCISLRDFPKYGHRGLLLDCARHFVSVTEIKKIIEQISLAKMNVLHWHLTNDQGWRIESKIFPHLHSEGEYYTQDEISEIVNFALERNVQIIPEISMPSHSTAAIRAYPHLSCKMQVPEAVNGGGIFRVVLCAGKESTYVFLYKLLDEICGLFPSQYIHLGGDETPTEEWEECPDCKARFNALDLKSYRDLQGYFLERITAFLEKKGKKAICWNDVLECGAIPESLTVQYWLDSEKGNAADLCNPLIFSDMFSSYLDYPHALIPIKKVYSYIPQIGGRVMDANKNVLGLEACLWSERIDSEDKLEEMIFPRIFALAENAWSERKDYEDFERRLAVKLQKLQDKRVRFTDLKGGNPSRKVCEQTAASFYNVFSIFLENLRNSGVSIYSAYSAEDIMQRFNVEFQGRKSI